jgi:hypothetical protein
MAATSANDKNMPMSTDGEKNSSHSEKSEHFFAGVRTCIPPTLNACVDTWCKFINFSDVEPGNIFSVEVGFWECVDNGVSGIRVNGSRVRGNYCRSGRPNGHRRGIRQG